MECMSGARGAFRSDFSFEDSYNPQYYVPSATTVHMKVYLIQHFSS